MLPYHFRFVALAISIILAPFACGCPLLVPGDKSHDLAMADEFLWAYQKEGARRIMIGAALGDVEEVINRLAASLGYKERKSLHQAVYSLFLQKKVIEPADTILIFTLFEEASNSRISHILLIKSKNTYTSVSVFRHAFYPENFTSIPNSMYHYDWVSAIESECRARGINAIVKR